MKTISTLAQGRGLEVNLNWGVQGGNELQASLHNSLQNFDQETEPYVISEIARQVIREKLLDDHEALFQIENFKELNNYDWLIFNNCFGTDTIPSTPVDDCPPSNESWKIPAATLMGLLSLTGHRVASYKDEMNGRLAHMVMPSKNNALYKTRSTKQLLPHTEVVNGLWSEEVYENASNHYITPDVFGLASIRNPTSCATRVWYLRDILDNLSYSTVQDLMRNEFKASSQSSFDVHHSIEGVSVISSFNNALSIRFSYTKLTGMTARASHALNQLKSYLDNEQAAQRIVLQPGQVLILNNRTLLHGRDNLQSHAMFDGNDRWLIRMYGFSNDGWRKLPKRETLQHVATV